MNTTVLITQCSRRTTTSTETVDEVLRRVAGALAGVERQYGKEAQEVHRISHEFVQMMRDNRFWPAGRILNNAGSRQNQVASCFVLPLHDDFDSILDTVKLAAHCHRTGGGTGFDLSSLRESGTEITSSEAAAACSPLRWLTLLDAETHVVMAAGKMRGANIATLSVYHPEVLTFVRAKATPGALSSFNLSVRVDDNFMRAVVDEGDIELRSPHDGSIARKIRASEIWTAILDNAWHTGEPGVVFDDHVNRSNPLRASMGPIESVNPCGEQPMYPFEASFLGSLNLAAFVAEGALDIDWQKLDRTIVLAVRLLDNAVDLCDYPAAVIADMSRKNRRIGLGVMGYADLLVKLGIPYDSEAALAVSRDLAQFIGRTAWRSSRELAAEKGAFPNFGLSTLQLPSRNCAVTAIAPTGTISMIAECSPGIEPRYARSFVKNVVLPEGINYDYSEDAAEPTRPSSDVTIPVERYAHDVSVDFHIATAAIWQEHIDNGISKTVNMASSATVDDVAAAFIGAWRGGCKGVTIYRDGSQPEQVLRARLGDEAMKPISASKNLAAVKLGGRPASGGHRSVRN